MQQYFQQLFSSDYSYFSIGHELTYGFKIKACQKLFVKAINSKINGITYIFWIKTKKIRSLKMYSYSY